MTAPPGTVVNARPPAAVAGGNVETSSRIADVTMAALGQAVPAPAAGQGTMNNLTLGNERFTYYETSGGGQGACPDADGPSGVHVAMSNTLNTPIEAFEVEFPLRVTEYALRRGSGGAGRHRGGDGIVREIEAREPMTFALLTERRRTAPPGRGRRRRGRSGAQPARARRQCAGRPPLESRRAACNPATACGWRPPAAGATARLGPDSASIRPPTPVRPGD